jgi:asparagine synthase (glutamine-hydrolysing)
MSDDCFGAPQSSDPQAQIAFASGNFGAAWGLLWTSGGPSAIARCTGPFAFAVQLPGGGTLAALDRFAIQSLCFRLDAGRIHFAQPANALADLSTTLDPQALYDYLYFHVIPSPRTVHSGVHRLPPGHYALFENGQLTVAPYWVPEFKPQRRGASFESLKTEFRKLLREAVAAQLDGSPPACFLSGGTDSSTVAGLIREVTGQAPQTYSIGFEAEGYDEMAYARIAARHFGTEHHEHYITPDDLVREIPLVAAHYDQPFGNSSAVPAYHCALMARQDGITRLLAGDGGDELFGGNSRYAKQKVFGLWDGLPSPMQAMLSAAFDNPVMGAVPGLAKVGSYIRQAKVPMPDRQQTYNLLERLGIAEVLTPGFLRLVDPQSPHRQQRDVWAQARGAGLLDRQLAFDWRYTLAENDLPKVCGTTALAGVSVGFPLLDTHLLEFSLGLPTHYKLRGLKLRWFFKEALRGFLPDEIITKKKHGFGLPFGVWATRHEGLRALARDSLGSLSARGVVRADFIRTLMDQRLAEHPGYYGEMVWILMMLEQWLRSHRPDYRIPA